MSNQRIRKLIDALWVLEYTPLLQNSVQFLSLSREVWVEASAECRGRKLAVSLSQVNLELALDAIAAVRTIFVNRCSGAAVKIYLMS